MAKDSHLYVRYELGRQPVNTKTSSNKKREKYGIDDVEGVPEDAKKSNQVARKIEKRQEDRKLDPHVEEQFSGGRLLAAISSRPGQCGRADCFVDMRYILEAKELEFYMKKL
ncbi:small ribosomal subunit protein eS8-like [Rutidosis leptorrhynchoides]|uniref:small ribosomal subunit protein eS8-like n=1 Tax=Rutidosis leptorrhynchoides TaxID=125765 RepID=UPI003A99D1E1